jgi:hypothetical protein
VKRRCAGPAPRIAIQDKTRQRHAGEFLGSILEGDAAGKKNGLSR